LASVVIITEELVTRAQGDVRDSAGRPGEHGQLAAVDPDKRLIALQLYDGVLKVGAGAGVYGVSAVITSQSCLPGPRAKAPAVPRYMNHAAKQVATCFQPRFQYMLASL
jgi:hypothetical protein